MNRFGGFPGAGASSYGQPSNFGNYGVRPQVPAVNPQPLLSLPVRYPQESPYEGNSTASYGYQANTYPKQAASAYEDSYENSGYDYDYMQQNEYGVRGQPADGMQAGASNARKEVDATPLKLNLRYTLRGLEAIAEWDALPFENYQQIARVRMGTDILRKMEFPPEKLFLKLKLLPNQRYQVTMEACSIPEKERLIAESIYFVTGSGEDAQQTSAANASVSRSLAEPVEHYSSNNASAAFTTTKPDEELPTDCAPESAVPIVRAPAPKTLLFDGIEPLDGEERSSGPVSGVLRSFVVQVLNLAIFSGEADSLTVADVISCHRIDGRKDSTVVVEFRLACTAQQIFIRRTMKMKVFNGQRQLCGENPILIFSSTGPERDAELATVLRMRRHWFKLGVDASSMRLNVCGAKPFLCIGDKSWFAEDCSNVLRETQTPLPMHKPMPLLDVVVDDDIAVVYEGPQAKRQKP